MPEQTDAILFAEEQSFRQPWLWGLLLGTLVFVAVVFGTIIHREPNNAGSLVFPAVLIVVVEIGVAVFLWVLKLKVRLDAAGLHIRFFPLVSKEIPLGEIAHWEARTYSPLLEYGGWGIRYSFRNGTAYNISGNQGVQLELTNGKRILIGSQRSEELAEAIHQAKDRS